MKDKNTLKGPPSSKYSTAYWRHSGNMYLTLLIPPEILGHTAIHRDLFHIWAYFRISDDFVYEKIQIKRLNIFFSGQTLVKKMLYNFHKHWDEAY